jgi:hypothetical protein
MNAAGYRKRFSLRFAPNHSFILQNWWVIACLMISYFLYSHGVHKKRESLSELEQRLTALHHEKKTAIETQEELKKQVRSQEDPAWIELTLMKGLGLVPDGQRKVYFKKSE